VELLATLGDVPFDETPRGFSIVDIAADSGTDSHGVALVLCEWWVVGGGWWVVGSGWLVELFSLLLKVSTGWMGAEE
jgi:hypothetical protein